MMTGVIPFATAILSVALMMSVILLVGLGGSADPQQRYLRLEGHVQWIGGQTMILATNGMYSYVPQALWSVRVDLTRVPQDEYDTLTQGDLVTVTGVLSDDNSRVVGTSIERRGPWEAESP